MGQENPKKKKIILVDDDESFVHSVQALLEAEDYTVIVAHNGQEGLQRARQERPDLMILDVMMTHNTEGFEISREIRKHPELGTMRIIMVTGIAKEMNLPFKFEPDDELLPVSVVLEKPVAPQKLLAAVKGHLA